MKLSLADWVFIIGLLFIIIPLFVMDPLIASMVVGGVLVTLSILLGKKGGG